VSVLPHKETIRPVGLSEFVRIFFTTIDSIARLVAVLASLARSYRCSRGRGVIVRALAASW
jgi:hypothetical protein